MNAVLDLTELDRQFAIPGVAKVSEGNGGLPRVEICGAFGSGEVYLHGAQITSWKPAGHDEVLFVSTKSHWQEGQAIRGGIPICFPWFRVKADDAHAPAHGVVRTRSWQLESIIENENGVAVGMVTHSDEQTRRWWPGEFRLLHRVTFGPNLTLELVCTNTGTMPFRFEEALHTYNRVADVEQVRLQGLDGMYFLDNTDSNKEKPQVGHLVLTAQTDSAYMNTGNAVDLLDRAMQRHIRLTKDNSLTTVVWNPWREGAAGLKDLGDGEWKQFLCVEASNILGDSVNLDPGQEHKLTAVLSVAKL